MGMGGSNWISVAFWTEEKGKRTLLPVDRGGENALCCRWTVGARKGERGKGRFDLGIVGGVRFKGCE